MIRRPWGSGRPKGLKNCPSEMLGRLRLSSLFASIVPGSFLHSYSSITVTIIFSLCPSSLPILALSSSNQYKQNRNGPQIVNKLASGPCFVRGVLGDVSDLRKPGCVQAAWKDGSAKLPHPTLACPPILCDPPLPLAPPPPPPGRAQA